MLFYLKDLLRKGVREDCEDRIGTGPPRARTLVIYADLGHWTQGDIGAHMYREREKDDRLQAP